MNPVYLRPDQEKDLNSYFSRLLKQMQASASCWSSPFFFARLQEHVLCFYSLDYKHDSSEFIFMIETWKKVTIFDQLKFFFIGAGFSILTVMHQNKEYFLVKKESVRIPKRVLHPELVESYIQACNDYTEIKSKAIAEEKNCEDLMKLYSMTNEV